MTYQKEYSYLHALQLGEESVFDNSKEGDLAPSYRCIYRHLASVVSFLNTSATNNRRYSLVTKGNGDKVAIRCVQEGDKQSDVPRVYNRVKVAAKKQTAKKLDTGELRSLIAEAVAEQLQKAKGPRDSWWVVVTAEGSPCVIFDTETDARSSSVFRDIKNARVVKVEEAAE